MWSQKAYPGSYNPLWGTYEEMASYYVDFLAPSPSSTVTFSDFVRYRRRIALSFMFVLVYVFGSEPWYRFYYYPFLYLSDWCRFTTMATYTIMWITHWKNGDYSRKVYQP
jgi:hypothetical protein